MGIASARRPYERHKGFSIHKKGTVDDGKCTAGTCLKLQTTKYKIQDTIYWQAEPEMELAEIHREVLYRFRNASNHSAPVMRRTIEELISQRVGVDVENVIFYRVCVDKTDAVFQPPDTPHAFISTCRTLDAATTLLHGRPPNPSANVVVEIVTSGRVISMLYDDDTADNRNKSVEDEVLVPISAVIHRCVVYRTEGYRSMFG